MTDELPRQSARIVFSYIVVSLTRDMIDSERSEEISGVVLELIRARDAPMKAPWEYLDAIANVTVLVVTGLFGLPEEAVTALMISFLREDVALGMLAP